MKAPTFRRVAVLLLCLGLGFFGRRVKADGFPLPLQNAGTWGNSPAQLIADIERGLQNSGFLNAVQVAGDMANKIGQGKVPMIDDLTGVIDGDMQTEIDAAVKQANDATQLLSKMDVTALQQLFTTLQTTVTTSQSFAFTIPGGRLVFRREGVDVSLCAVVAGPGGARVTLGMSTGQQLGGNPAERFVNPTREPVLFVDFALGYSNLQVRRKLLAPPVPPTAPDPNLSIQAATYFKIHDDWVQLRFAGNDPQALSLKLQFVIGVKGGVSAEIQAEVEGQVLLEVEVRPTQVAAMLRDIGDILKNGLATTSPASLKAAPATVAPVLKQVFNYLQKVEDSGESLGGISIGCAVDGAVGVGIWDTGINAASVGGQITLSVPLEALIALSGDVLASQLEAGLQTSTQIVALFEAMSEGRLNAQELGRQRALIEQTSQQFGLGLVEGFVGHLDAVQLNLVAGVYALGDIGQVASQTIPLLVASVDVPVGQILVDGVNSVPRFVKGVSETAQAMAWLAETAIDAGLKASDPLSLGKIIQPPTHPLVYVQRPRGIPPVPPTPAEWEAMATDLLDGVTLSLQLGVVGIEGVSLGNMVRLAGGAGEVTATLLTAAVESAVTAKDKPILDALRAAPDQLQGEALDLLYFNLKTLSVSFQPSLGANGTVGAEGAVGLGARIGLDARLKASLILLALGNTNYDDPKGTLLAGFDIPIEASVSAGVSVGEGVEFTAEGGFTAGASLANLSLKDWGQDLPAPAGLTVAGFEVIDFTGVTRQDGAVSGRGWMVLPMGGLVRADEFALAHDGRVLDGRWSGVLELGPFGEVPVAGGKILSNALSGTSDFVFGINRLNTDFILRNDGLLFGHTKGRLSLAGLEFAADLRLDEGGFLGSGKTTILGSEFNSTNFRIRPNGSLEGSFSGTLAVDGQLLTLQKLEIQGNKLRGRTTLNLGGQQAVELLLTVDANGVIGTFVSDLDLYGAGKANAWVRITDKIEVFGAMDGQFLGSLESVLRGQLLAGIAEARETLRREQENLAARQAAIADFDRALVDLRKEILAEQQAARAAAEAAVKDAEDALRFANQRLDEAIAALSAVSGDLARQLDAASAAFRAASSAVSAARGEVDKINRQIAALDGWYNRLDPVGKVVLFVGYQASRAAMVAALGAANGVLAGAQAAYNAAADVLHAIEKQLTQAQSLLDDKALKERLVAEAEARVQNAKRDLEAIVAVAADPALDPRYIAVVIARDGVLQLIQAGERLIATTRDLLGQAAGLIDHINRYGEGALVKVKQVQFRSTLADLNKGFAELIVDADVANQPKRFVIPFDFKTGQNADNIAAAARQLSPQLYPATAWTVLPWTDDGSSGLTSRTLWAYHFNATDTATVGSVAVVGVPGITPAVPGRFSVEGFVAGYPGDQNLLTDGTGGTGGSSSIASNFIYGASPGTVTFEGLTPGRAYRATFLSVGWDDAPTLRNITFSSDTDRRLVSQNAYGNNHGIRIDHTFTATSESHSVTLKPEAAETFHLYALALSVDGDLPLTFDDWKQNEFGILAFTPGIADEGADPDGDGIPNFLEYAIRSNPQAKDASSFALPVPVTLSGSVEARQFNIPYQAAAGDIVYRVRHSTDLTTWTDIYRHNLATGESAEVQGVSGVTDDATQTIKLLISDPSLFAPPSFWRLSVEKP